MPFALPGQSILWRGGRRVVVGGGAAKTYEQFLDHISGRPSLAWDAPMTITATPTLYRSGGNSEGGFLIGTTWGSVFSPSSSYPRAALQHGLPSYTVFQDQVANNRQMGFTAYTSGTSAFTGITRNGFTSTGSVNPGPAGYMTEVIYWTPAGVFSMNPHAMTGPTPYTW